MRKIIKNGECADCGKNTFQNRRDYYMVKMDIWNRFGLGKTSRDIILNGVNTSWTEDEPSGMLCILCLENRMGRKIKKSDLYPCLANEINPYLNKK